MVLVRGDLDFNLISIRTDDEGLYCISKIQLVVYYQCCVLIG